MPNKLFISLRLKLVNAILDITQLLQETSQSTLTLVRVLVTADCFHQWRRTAHKDNRGLDIRLGHCVLDQVKGNVALVTSPAGSRLFQNVMNTEAIRESLCKAIQLVFEQDVFLSGVAKDQGEFGGLISGFGTKYLAQQLELMIIQ